MQGTGGCACGEERGRWRTGTNKQNSTRACGRLTCNAVQVGEEAVTGRGSRCGCVVSRRSSASTPKHTDATQLPRCLAHPHLKPPPSHFFPLPPHIPFRRIARWCRGVSNALLRPPPPLHLTLSNLCSPSPPPPPCICCPHHLSFVLRVCLYACAFFRVALWVESFRSLPPSPPPCGSYLSTPTYFVSA